MTVEDDLIDDGYAKPKATFPLVMGVSMAVIGASFQYGYNIAVVNAPADEIKDFYFGPLTCRNSTNATMTATCSSSANSSHKTYRDNLFAVAVSAFAAAGMIGSLLVGPVVAKFGRLGGLMINNGISVVSAIFLVIAKPLNSFALIIIGRILIGIFAGLATGVVPMYIGEISPKQWRGAIGVLNQLLITIGILVAQLFGLQGALGTDELWPYLLAFTCVPSIISTACYKFMPKSPRYLLIDQNKEEEAKQVLIKLRGTENVLSEMNEMKSEAAEQASAGQLSIRQLFRLRNVRWQLITVLLMMVVQQLSGINAVFFCPNTIFDKAGIPKGNSQDLASVAVGTVNVLMTIISVGVIERAGRKALMVGGFGMMIFWCAAITVIHKLLLVTNIQWISYLSIACVIGYIIGFAIGPGPIPWLITAELFQQAARPTAFMVVCLLNWTCNCIIGISFPAVVEVTGPYVFIIFMLVCICITVFLALVMPEIKGKTFQEISDLFAVRNKVPKTVSVPDHPQKVPLNEMDEVIDEVPV